MSSNINVTLFLPLPGEEESRIIFALEVIKAQIKIIRRRNRKNEIEILARDVQIIALEKAYKYIDQNNDFDLWMNKEGEWFLSAANKDTLIFSIQATAELVEEIQQKNPNNVYLKRILMESHFNKK